MLKIWIFHYVNFIKNSKEHIIKKNCFGLLRRSFYLYKVKISKISLKKYSKNIKNKH